MNPIDLSSFTFELFDDESFVAVEVQTKVELIFGLHPVGRTATNEQVSVIVEGMLLPIGGTFLKRKGKWYVVRCPGHAVEEMKQKLYERLESREAELQAD